MISPYCARSSTGHQVSASRHGQAHATAWQFAAWSPRDKPEMNYWQWAEQAHHQSHYTRGQAVPQRRRCLGIYPTADAARAACEAHHTQQSEPTHA